MIFAAESGARVSDSAIIPDFVDVFWIDNSTFALRYQDRFNVGEQRYYYSTVSLSEDRGHWRWGSRQPSPNPSGLEVEVVRGEEIRVRQPGPARKVTAFRAGELLGSTPAQYRTESVRALRSGDKVVVIRSLLKERGEQPRRRHQIARREDQVTVTRATLR